MDEIQCIFERYKDDITDYYKYLSEFRKEKAQTKQEFRLVSDSSHYTFVLKQNWSEQVSNALKLPIAIVERIGEDRPILYAAYVYEEKVRMVVVNLVDVPVCRVYFKTLWNKSTTSIKWAENEVIFDTLENAWGHVHLLLKQQNHYRLYVETGLWNVIKE